MNDILSRRGLLRFGALAGGTVAATAGIAACNREPRSAAKGGIAHKPKSGNGEYVEVLTLTSLPYFVDHKLGMDAAGEYFGVKTDFVGPAQFDLAGMINALEEQISRNVSGLVVVGFDPSLKPSIDKAVDAGIPTVTVDADVPDSKRLCFLGTGNEEAGELGGQTLSKLVGGKGKVLLITKPGQSNLEERLAGYKKVLAGSGITIVQVANDDSDAGKAAGVVKDTLQKYPDLAGIGCVEAAGGAGAATALREAGKIGQVKVVSMDRDVATLDAIDKGVIQASVAQKSALMTFEAVSMLVRMQTMDLRITKNNGAAHVSPLPSSVDTGIQIITKDNVAQWKK